MINPNKTLSLAIMSGKGGVGKTSISLNLGYALYQAGLKTLLMDCDLGLANLDVLLGLAPEKNLQDLLKQDTKTADVAVAVEQNGLDVLPAASGVPELVDMDEDMQNVLLEKIVQLAGKYHALILDLGAGISRTVMTFAAMSQLRVIVVTPEPTSLTDGYAVIKVLATEHKVKDFLVLVNRVESKSEGDKTFNRLAEACRAFLNIEIQKLGHIREDRQVGEAVRRQKALLALSPSSPSAQDIVTLSNRLKRYRSDNADAISRRPVLRQFSTLNSDF
ncbi:flagellar biosynthesis protein FlhG [Paucidesulfovibrio gracilis DSM 16080]|uniref:Flagellar biosynthesis protein FlhG n=1 Tax=Paucidesulfovibrio gracilis DSM 16080 TaxID=1121449 RepID=A0A1T4WM68_9BACT|nr:MinD/ParA family protein [Paucidesulfovibrio gracilis]SKA78424.1 flagellar biosynthesis protein FlhG [Paucidesulfovibrio gracilis DSM 16080]